MRQVGDQCREKPARDAKFTFRLNLPPSYRPARESIHTFNCAVVVNVTKQARWKSSESLLQVVILVNVSNIQDLHLSTLEDYETTRSREATSSANDD